MRPLEIDKQTALAHILNELKNTPEDGLEITAVPEEKTLLDNALNRKIIEKAAAFLKKKVNFPSIGPAIEEMVPAAEDNLGFVEGEDVVSKLPMEEVPKVVQPATLAQPSVAVKKDKKFTLPNLKIFKNKFALAGGVFALIIIILALAFIFLPTAVVDLTLSTNSKEAQVELVADPKATSVDTTAKIVPMTTDKVSKDGSEELATSTKKTIGTNATGRVTITNQDTSGGKDFLVGTLLTPVSTGSATFKTKDAISLPPAPAGDKTSGDVNVVATSPGEDGNLPASTTFKVGTSNVTFVFAKNNLAFSGGSSKQVTVATQSDRDALKAQIVDKLTLDAKKDLDANNSDSLIVDGGIDTKITKETYDPKAVDAEADKLKATISLDSTATIVKKDDLKGILVKLLQKDESGFKVDEASSEITATLVEKTADGTVKINAHIKATLLPDLSKSDIINHIKGKGLSGVGAYLDSLDKVSDYKVTTSPSFLRFFRMMPFFQSKITVNFITQ